jgi:rare lipoprotein A (peptidoglycan hydrolase)
MNNFICICGLLLVDLLAPQAPSARLPNSEADTSSGHRSGAKAHRKVERANRNVRPRILRGSASWYGRHFEGKKTASGTTFHADGHTAAAEGIPLGSTVKVTNLKNGRSARVKVTDRGPKVPGRVVDVSKGTAEQLGMTEKGVTPVKVTVVKPPPPKTEATPSESDKTEAVTETKPGKSPQ